MCGIFALIHPPRSPVSLHEIRCACSLIRHRGPDQSGYALLHGQTVGFGHNRLSIQEPDAPPQPLSDPSTGTTIIFSGEVYDHIELGRSLKEEHGVTLTQSTDTAVVLALYILYGPTSAFFSRLNGEFAFVIWDAQRKQIVAARDRFGIKPLAWYFDGKQLIFASEIKAIASVSGVDRKFSAEWLDKVYPMINISPHLTFMEGVFNVLPGKYLTMDLSTDCWDAPKYSTYWSALEIMRAPGPAVPYEEAKAEVRRLVTASVKRRLVADREMCVYLSGGVDSTVVCGLVRELGHPLTAITIGFGDHIFSEDDLANKTALHYSLPRKLVTYTAADTAKYAQSTIYHTEIPFFNPHCIAKFRLSEFARENGFVVSLTGEGSDELMLGYAFFRSEVLLKMRSQGGEQAVKAQRLSEIMTKKEITLAAAARPDEIPRIRGEPSWTAWYFRRLLMAVDALRAPYPDGRALPSRSLEDFTSAEAEGFSGVRMAQIQSINTLHNFVIPCLGDRVEMASAIEGRPPLLDAKFADYVLGLPLDYLIDPDTLREKKILYDAFEDLLPPHIRSRTKHPFMAPGWREPLFKTEEGRALKEKHLSREALERVGVWLPERVDELLRKLDSDDATINDDHIVGFVLSVQMLHALFIECEVVGDPDFPMVDRTPANLV